MARRGARATAELVSSLVELGTRRLVEGLDLAEPQAREAMREIAHDLARNYGGQVMYIPKDHEFELTKRDLQIYERLNGDNVNELAREWNLSVQQIYNINRAVRDQLQRKRQGQLPGLEVDAP